MFAEKDWAADSKGEHYYLVTRFSITFRPVCPHGEDILDTLPRKSPQAVPFELDFG